MNPIPSVACGVLLFCAATAAALAHAKVELSVPAADAVLDASPPQVSVRFNETLEPAFSSLTLVDAARLAVPAGKATIDAGDPRSITLALPKLAAGAYEVRWVAVGHDGHRVTGAYRFSVK